MKDSARLALLLLGLLCVLASLTSCQKSTPVVIGFIGGLSGSGADLGVAGRNGAMLAVEEANAGGGLQGHPIRLLVRDDQGNPEIAKKTVNELFESKVAVIIGPMISSIAVATVPLANAARTVMISPTATTTDLADQDDYFFRVISTTTGYATRSAQVQYERFGRRRVAAFYDGQNSSYSESWLRDFRSAFEKQGGLVVKTVAFQEHQDDYTQITRELIASKPDAILIIANAVNAAFFSQQIRKQNSQLPIFLSEWAATERFIELAGSAAEGIYLAAFLNRNDTSQRYATFLQAYRARFGSDPGFSAMASYDATNIALEALSRQSANKTLKESLQAIPSFQGVQQTIRLDRFGESDRKVFGSIIHNGQFVAVE